MYDVDLFVVGGGSGGVRAARVAAGYGAKVAIAEAYRWGGTCVIRGCVPKKLLVYASEVSRTLDDARGQGWTIAPATFDWPTLIAAKDREIARLSNAYQDRLRKAGVRLLDGRATIVDLHTIEVNSERITAANIVIATGGIPRIPGIGEWITSNEAFHLPQLPKKIAIAGGGYIGVEFAHIFAGFGVEVTLVHRDRRLLRGFDPDLEAEVALGLTARGVRVVLEAEVTGSERTATGGHKMTLTPRDPQKPVPSPIECDLAMAATGRAPNIEGLGMAELGVNLDCHGGIVVDEYSRTNIAHLFAIGDVNGRLALTPTAIREGHAVADTLFGGKPTAIDHRLIPTAVFGQPPAAAVGLTESAANAAGHDVKVFRARFRPMKYALSGRDEHVMMKLVVDRATDRVLGMHMVGVDAAEIVQAAAIAITMGATKADFDRTVALHPTTAEELVLLK